MAKQPQSVARRVETLVRPVVEGLGVRLWDVRFEKEGSEWTLRILIDRPGEAMDTDTCEVVSRAVDPLLDAEDPIEQSYYLEVGSPGLGRKLTRPEHFEAVRGEKVSASLYSADDRGRKHLAGILQGVENGEVLLLVEGETLRIGQKQAGSFKLCDDEDLFG